MMHKKLAQGSLLYSIIINDNKGKVCDFLQSLKLYGSAWPWVNAFQRMHNGRGAWKALLAQEVMVLLLLLLYISKL